MCGLNNYNQLGVAEVNVTFDENTQLISSFLYLQGLTFYMPVESRDLSGHSWGGIAIGQHHAIGQVLNCLESDRGINFINCQFYLQEKDGRVLALGRSEYGRLGLGEGEN